MLQHFLVSPTKICWLQLVDPYTCMLELVKQVFYPQLMQEIKQTFVEHWYPTMNMFFYSKQNTVNNL